MLAQMISPDASVQKLWGTHQEQEMKEMEKGNIKRFLEVTFFPQFSVNRRPFKQPFDDVYILSQSWLTGCIVKN